MSKRDMEEKSGIARPQEGEYAMLKLNREEKEKFFELIYKLASCDGVLGEKLPWEYDTARDRTASDRGELLSNT